jgi:hypothetical protein
MCSISFIFTIATLVHVRHVLLIVLVVAYQEQTYQCKLHSFNALTVSPRNFSLAFAKEKQKKNERNKKGKVRIKRKVLFLN